MVEYKHTLNEAICRGLIALHNYGQSVNIRELNMSRTQWDNFQKLRYWDLVQQIFDKDGKRKRGIWGITNLGIRFVLSQEPVFKSVWTYRGERVRYEETGGKIFMYEAVQGYQIRDDYAKEAQPHTNSNIKQNVIPSLW